MRVTFETLETCLELNRSAHHWDEGNRWLSPEDGVCAAVEVVEQVLDLGAGVEWLVAVVFEVAVAPIQGPQNPKSPPPESDPPP